MHLIVLFSFASNLCPCTRRPVAHSFSRLCHPSRGRVSINKVFLDVNHLLGGGLLGLSGRGLLLLLSRGSLGSGLSLGRGPEGLVGNAGQRMNKLNHQMI